MQFPIMAEFQGTILIPVRNDLTAVGGWNAGPIALSLPDGGVTNAEARSTYFEQRAAGVLYGEREDTDRRHRLAAVEFGDLFRLTALEWLAAPDLRATAGVLIAHVEAEVEDPGTVRESWGSLVRWKRGEQGRGKVLQVVEHCLGCAVEFGHGSQDPYRIAFIRGVPESDSQPFETANLEVRTAWLFALASGVSPQALAPSGRQANQMAEEQQDLSSDWSALVLRDGAAFVGHTVVNERFIETYAPIFVRTIYTDALLLGVVQRLALTELTDRLASLEDPARHPRKVEKLDAAFSGFRNRLWWQHLTHHGTGNELLRSFQRQHGLDDLFHQTRSELDDYSRQAGLRASRVLNVIVALFAVIGGVGVGIDVYRLFNPAPAVPSLVGQWFSGLIVLTLLALVAAFPLGLLEQVRFRNKGRG